LHKVLVIGSGPIIIGQAAEFDYAGTQACKALKEEGLEVVLVNSNPATIMTDPQVAGRVYLEPLDAETLTRIIVRERPQGLLPTLGGQTGLNLAVELAEAGVLREWGVELLGTPLQAIKRAEDREAFRATMLSLGEPLPESRSVSSVAQALDFAGEVGFPLIIRPAYTLGGTGGGFAHNQEELAAVTERGLKASLIRQVLVEKSVAGWKEIEYEVLRDSAGNSITVCNMENFDPVGVHTGDSIVVAPSQTLSDREYQMLRSASLKIINALGVEGGCNIQFALDPNSLDYRVIEVNPRVSRSSALASKATGYPIAKMAAKIAVGFTLDELLNPVTGRTSACFEPALDYVVVKIPRWPFDKFAAADRTLGTQMKATGEVMAVGKNFESALLKAVRSLETGVYGLKTAASWRWSEMELEDCLAHPDDQRLFAVAEAFRRGWSVAEVFQLSRIDSWFLNKIEGLIKAEKTICEEALTPANLRQAKELGFSDEQIARLKGKEPGFIRDLRRREGIIPAYQMVDTCAGEFEAQTPYFYSTYESVNEALPTANRKVLVLGSGPIRIGQGIEFDYCSVQAVLALRQAGYEALIVNNNPETVSTDFDTADRLYFEPLTLEDVLSVIDNENPLGVMVQFGGQTAINLAAGLKESGVRILGTSVAGIDLAEDRGKFSGLLKDLGVSQTEGGTATSPAEALKIANRLGYPVLVRPSYVIGGRAMEVVPNPAALEKYMTGAIEVSPRHPVLVDKYLPGTEVEVDAVADGTNCLIAGIMEHIERAGVHSGDSMAVYPAQSLSRAARETIIGYTAEISRALKVQGLLNIQFVVWQEEVYVLEVNPRASRTVPVLSKITGFPLVAASVRAALGESLTDQGYSPGLWPEPGYTAVKAPVFSFEKLAGVEVSLGPEMKSTGEVLGLGPDLGGALYKALKAARLTPAPEGTVLVSLADRDKSEALAVSRPYHELGYALAATADTAQVLRMAGLPVKEIDHAELVSRVAKGEFVLVINTPTSGKVPGRTGFQLRRAALESGVPCLTSLDTARALAGVLGQENELAVLSLNDYLEQNPNLAKKQIQAG